MGFRPSGRPFRGVQKASFLGSGLVRIPSAFRPQNTGKRGSCLWQGVPTGSCGQSGETSQSRHFPVRGSQSFQAVRKRLRDLGSNEATHAGSIPVGPTIKIEILPKNLEGIFNIFDMLSNIVDKNGVKV
jgi:hypothetical protein